MNKDYKKEIEELRKMLRYYGNVILVRECDKGIVLITENKKTLSFVERDGEIYHLVYQVINLISQECITFEDALNKFEEQAKSRFEFDKDLLSYIEKILNDDNYSIKFTDDIVFPIFIQYTDEENNIHQTYLNHNSNQLKALEFKIKQIKEGR